MYVKDIVANPLTSQRIHWRCILEFASSKFEGRGLLDRIGRLAFKCAAYGRNEIKELSQIEPGLRMLF